MKRFEDPFALLKGPLGTPQGKKLAEGAGGVTGAFLRAGSGGGAPKPTAAQRAASEAENVAKVQKRNETRAIFDEQTALSHERRNKRSLLGGSSGGLGGRSLLG